MITDKFTETLMNNDSKNIGEYVAIIGYMISSSLLLLVNKLIIHQYNCPIFILLTQLFVTALTTFSLGVIGYIDVDALCWTKVKKFWLVPVAFMMTIFSNIKILQYSNVETFIVFRATTPLLLCVIEPWFLRRDLPGKTSIVSLTILFLGALSYVLSEKGEFSVESVTWVIVWFTLFIFDQVFIKHVVDTVDMTTWGRVYYSNLLPVIPMFFAFIFSDEYTNIHIIDKMPFLLPVSWVIGTSISFFAFMTRKAISATSFTVVGNTCKFITVALNMIIWDNHASPNGLLSLIICILAAYIYKPAKILDEDDHKRLKRVMLYYIPYLVLSFLITTAIYMIIWCDINIETFDR